MDQNSQALALYALNGEIAEMKSIEEKAQLIEAEIGMETLFSMIASGFDKDVIAEQFGMTSKQFEYVCKRNGALRKRWISAKLSASAEKSLSALEEYEDKSSFMIEMGDESGRHAEDKAAIAHSKHHRDMLNIALKSIGTSEDSSSRVVINNNTYVAGEKDIPDIPGELIGIIDDEED